MADQPKKLAALEIEFSFERLGSKWKAKLALVVSVLVPETSIVGGVRALVRRLLGLPDQVDGAKPPLDQ